MNERYDVIIIGGGAAGLSGALTLARARRSVLVIDSGAPRNKPASHVHNFLTRDGTPPAELLALARAEVTSYGVDIVDGTVVSAQPGFVIELSDGRTVRARRLLVTTGLVDELPEIPGVAERFGGTVIHCPYCHGWEVRDQAIGVIAASPEGAMHQALLFRQLSDDVIVFQHTVSEITAAQLEELAARGIRVVTGEVAAVEDKGVRLVSGDFVERQAVVVATRMTARSQVLAGLGLQTAEQMFGDHVIGTYVPSDPMGATSVPGVWVAGNVTNLAAQVIVAAAAGLNAAAAINFDLVTEDTRLAVAAHREE